MWVKICNFWFNIISLIGGFILGRNKRIVLVGAWMGERFSDNSRYLFQYLHENKDTLGLDDVIWATRNEELVQILKKEGYHSCLVGTSESRSLHLKAGIHIICNMAFRRLNLKTDIDTKYSFGSKRIQLWHGVGIKSVGYSSNEYKKINPVQSILKRIIHSRRLAIFNSLGAWENARVLATSPSNAALISKVLGCSERDIVISGYPRNCECLHLLDNEQNVINLLKQYNRVILYLPTFRDANSSYDSPLKDPKMLEYIKQNNILWVEKPHLAETNFRKTISTCDNVLTLESSFDTNVLYPYVTLVVSDYSSVVFDAIYKRIPVVVYVPDLVDFMKGTVGLAYDIREICYGLTTYTVPEIITMSNQVLSNDYFDEIRNNTYDSIIAEFWNNYYPTYAEIWNRLQ